MSPGARALLTGHAAILPLGLLDPDELWRALLEGRTAVAPSDDGPAAPLPDWDVSDWVDSRQTRRMSPLSCITIAAAQQALAHAGLDLAAAPGTGLVFCSRLGSTAFLRDYHEGLLAQGSASPFLFTNGVANAPAGHVSLEYGLRGPCSTLMGGAVSAALGLADALDALAAGRRSLALLGAAEELTPFLLAAQAAAARALGGEGGPAPGEGGVFLVMEDEEYAQRRGAAARARVRLWEPSSEAPGARARSLLAGTAGPAAVLVSHGPGRDAAGETELLGALSAEAGGGVWASAPRAHLGEAFAASALAAVHIGARVLASDAVPPRPASWTPPAGVEDLFPRQCREGRVGCVLALVSEGGEAPWVIRLDRS